MSKIGCCAGAGTNNSLLCFACALQSAFGKAEMASGLTSFFGSALRKKKLISTQCLLKELGLERKHILTLSIYCLRILKRVHRCDFVQHPHHRYRKRLVYFETWDGSTLIEEVALLTCC